MEYHKMIAPRLANGESREPWGGRLPEEIKEGLRAIARAERKSLSWVMEEVCIRYFNLRTPDYVKPTKVTKPSPAAIAKGRKIAAAA